ncbi:MAG TPA: [Fe-Fe] hydrogenase large subunit C-terminal domain-containing protein [Spirochaetia bacterium]|nr:[Fe-Fe] hydrogenase large subunit C-terminal domain-containing protein [Spirochaetia bacterium]
MVSVYTVGEICKKCYSCVRSCPTKALQVRGGQAEIIEDFCISCGYCVNVCSQGAKRVTSSLGGVKAILGGPGRKYALLAPSFPAAFLNLPPEQLVGALQEVGFDGVFEVAFGADLVSYRYFKVFHDLVKKRPDDFLISTPCPAVVQYVEKMRPELTPHLAPIVSPMEAMARVVKEKVDDQAKVVFIGPCVAKKVEAWRSGVVDAVLTFSELVDLFEGSSVDPRSAPPAAFLPPAANLGRIYPVTGGLLKAAAIDDDLLESPVYIVEGQDRVMEILRVLSDRVKSREGTTYRLFDLLFCEGCIGGPVMVNDLTFYERKKYVVGYLSSRPCTKDIEQWAVKHADYLDIDLSKSFSPAVREELPAPEEEIRRILALTGKNTPADELNCGACGYPSCRQKAEAVYRGKAEVEMCLPYLISRIEKAMKDLTENHARLIQAEKLASMGQMAAGIAHEINNPLGVVLMYSHLLKDELGDPSVTSNAATAKSREDLDRIIAEAERTRTIVRGILNFAREEKVERAPTDINALVRSSASAILGTSPNGKIRIEFALDQSLPTQWVDGGQLRQVFDNLLKNAVEAMPGGGLIRVSTKDGEAEFVVTISDTGPGIPEENLPKLFSPFFTTKKVGKGTGLGLSVCYGIVKMHEGTIHAANNPGGGACFTVSIRHHAGFALGATKEEGFGSNTDR